MRTKLTFMKQWYDALAEDQNLDLTEQDLAYILYAAARYAFADEKINIGEVFGKEFKGLNIAMPNIYSQMDNIKEFGERNKGVNQRYDNEKVKELAALGYTQKEVCLELGYDVDKSKSLSSNKGWKEGRALFEQGGSRIEDSSVIKLSKNSENCQKTVKNFDF